MSGSESESNEQKETEKPSQPAEVHSESSEKQEQLSDSQADESPEKAATDSVSEPEPSSSQDNSPETATDKDAGKDKSPELSTDTPVGKDKSPQESANEDGGKDDPSESGVDETANQQASSLTLTQHHVSHLLSDVLQDEAPQQNYKGGLRFPMILDLLLGAGLLVAVGGFTIGLFHMYLVHSASQSISEQRYKAAIAILKGAPLPVVFARPGSETEELLSKARYLDAMEKLENTMDKPDSEPEIREALNELGQIQPGSKYFALAQEAINENTEPAPVMLQGGAETTETNPVPEEKPTLLEKTLKED